MRFTKAQRADLAARLLTIIFLGDKLMEQERNRRLQKIVNELVPPMSTEAVDSFHENT